MFLIVLFILFALCVASAWFGKRNLAIWLFIVFLVATAALFYSHITDHINIQL